VSTIELETIQRKLDYRSIQTLSIQWVDKGRSVPLQTNQDRRPLVIRDFTIDILELFSKPVEMGWTTLKTGGHRY
jgi:hypothetical protein